ncbi:MAG: SMP-30/gluconolactonase/LRE family protein [Armatimonadetes bacterium]|jgi:sugar lactone lactonase YvrE|nr:SMP-30/gluconolactonase/LRE family protein [Armatimonadota bacterium]
MKCFAALLGIGVLVGAGLAVGSEGGRADAIFVDATPERLATGFQFTEGPVWSEEGYLLFSDIPPGRIYRWTPDGKCVVFREPSGNSNGLAFDRQGRLLACEHGNRRLSRLEKDGTARTLADRVGGKRLNSPNDLAVRSDGAIYFTDPPWGVKPEERELAYCGVYRLAPNGKLSLLADDFEHPNGIAFSPDERTLYVGDDRRRQVRAFDVRRDGRLANGRVLFQPEAEANFTPDGMKVDVKGNLYVTGSASGLWVVSPKGEVLARVSLLEGPANCAFGGPDHRWLFLTAGSSLYRLRTRHAGCVPRR